MEGEQEAALRSAASCHAVFYERDERPMNSLFLCDIDGTLLCRDAPLGAEGINAARDFTAAGGLLSLCTGRSVPAAAAVAAALGVNLPCILYGGAALYDFAAQKFLYVHPFPSGVLQGATAVLQGHPAVSMQVFTAQDAYVLRRNTRLNTRGVREENTAPLSSLYDVEGAVIKLVMCGDNIAELAYCRRYFPTESCDFAFASRNFVDVVAKGCSKADAMKELSRRLSLPFSCFIAAGDAMTDLPMLRLAGKSFAPANACEAVREAAGHVVPDVREGGMAEAFHMAARWLQDT